MDFAEKIKKYREDNNLTQDDLAEKLHVSRQSISKWETGNSYPSYEILLDISKLLKQSIDDLLSKREVFTQAVVSTKNKRKAKIILASAFGVAIVAATVLAVSISIAVKARNALENLNAKVNPCANGHLYAEYVDNDKVKCDSYATLSTYCKNCGAIKFVLGDEKKPNHQFYLNSVQMLENKDMELQFKCKQCGYCSDELWKNFSSNIKAFFVEKDGMYEEHYFSYLPSYREEDNHPLQYTVREYKLFDGKERIMSDYIYYWNESLNSFIDVVNHNYYRDEQGRTVQDETKMWSFDGICNRPYSYEVKKYNENDDRIFSEYLSDWSAEKECWTSGTREEIEYINNKEVSDIRTAISPNTYDWVVTFKRVEDRCDIPEGGYKSSRDLYYYDMKTGESKTEKHEWFYNEDSILTSALAYYINEKDGEITSYKKHTVSCDENGGYVDIITELNLETNEMENVQSEICTVLEDGKKTYTYYEWSDSLNDWVFVTEYTSK